MSIRIRLLAAFVLIGLMPALAIGLMADSVLANLNTLITDTTRGIIEKNGLEDNESLIVLESNATEIIQTAAIRLPLIVIGALLVAMVVGSWLASSFLGPVLSMKIAASQVAEGNPDVFKPLLDRSELGELSRSLYGMILRLQDDIRRLQQQVDADRNQMVLTSEQCDAISQLVQIINIVQDEQLFFDETVRYISDRFGHYQVGLFMFDNVEDFLVLRAASSSGGKRLLSRNYRMKVDEGGIVGQVAKFGKPYISIDVANDRFFVAIPELPETRSEIAVPLRIQNKIVGVLDVHSIHLSAFSLDDVHVFEIIAEQIASSVDNLHLRRHAKRLANELEIAHGKQVQGAWEQYLHGVPLGYVFTHDGVEPLEVVISGEEDMSINQNPRLDLVHNRLEAPLMIRGQVIGSVVFKRETSSKPWTESELLLVLDVLEQISPALEGARLLEETLARASHEQAVNIISTQVRRSASVDDLLQNTVRELGKVLGSSHTFIQLVLDSPDQGQG